MDVETYGGKCPICGKNMLQKGDPRGLSTWYSFDACPWCGFAFGDTGEEEYTKEQVWQSIYAHMDCSSREELIKKYNLEKIVPEEEWDFNPSVFYWNEKFIKKYNELNNDNVKLMDK